MIRFGCGWWRSSGFADSVIRCISGWVSSDNLRQPSPWPSPGVPGKGIEAGGGGLPPLLSFSRARAALVYLIVGAAFVALLGRVAYLQSWGREQNIGRAERQQHQTETLYARRGSIFDRSGMLMAGTVQEQALYVDPKFMQDSFQENGH